MPTAPAPVFDLSSLAALLALLITLSLAAERLVGFIKNLPYVGPWLQADNPNPDLDGLRRVVLQVLAVGAGMLTAWLAAGVLPVIKGTFVNGPDTLARSLWLLGLLASGGSGFWTSILGYVSSIKDIKKTEAIGARVQTAANVAAIANGSDAPAFTREIASFNTSPATDNRPVDAGRRQQAHANLNKAISLANATL